MLGSSRIAAVVVASMLTWGSAHGASPLLRSATADVDRAALRGLTARICHSHNMDFRLVDAVIRVESDYNPWAVSRKGAMGLMQLMPATAQRLDVADPFDPEQNVSAGIRELVRLIDGYAGDLVLALAAYNAGEGAVQRHGGIPPYSETRNYVSRIMSLYLGRPYRLNQERRPPPEVRLVQDSANGRTIITNQLRAGQSPRALDVPPDLAGTLRGGFGSK